MVICTSWFNPSERWRIIYFINVTDVKQCQLQIKNNSVVIAVLKKHSMKEKIIEINAETRWMDINENIKHKNLSVNTHTEVM